MTWTVRFSDHGIIVVMRILLLGDVHAQHELLAGHLARWHRRHGLDACIQVGDFGFYRQHWGRCRLRFPIPIHAICGNHENHRWLRKMIRRGAQGEWRERGLIYQPRGSMIRLDGVRIGFLGGALNIDRPQRGFRRWRTTNYIVSDETNTALDHFDREQPDLIVTHSCPSGIGIGLRGNPALAADVLRHVTWAGYCAGPQDDCGEAELTRLWRGLRHRPPLWVFGHFHQHWDIAIEETRFLCVPCLESGQPLAIYDTRTRAVEWVAVHDDADPSS